MYLVLWVGSASTYSWPSRGGSDQGRALQPGDQPAQVGSGELPFERRRELFVALLEGHQSALDRVEVGEVVRGEHLALDDAEVDLDLVEPTGMDGQVDETEVRPGPWGSETRIRSCGGAVVLVDEPAEQIPPANISRLWPDDRFDIVWVFEPGSSGDSWRLRQVPQLLLAGDRAEPIA